MSCSNCGRELNARPNDLCPSVIHWQAWAERLMVALNELFDGPPEVWGDWFDRNKEVYDT
jgi:hypothetical protein